MYNQLYNDPMERLQHTYGWAYWDGAFTDQDLQNVITQCEAKEKTSGTTIGSKDAEESRQFRISNVSFHTRDNNTEWFFDKLNGVISALNERFYNYNLNGYADFQYTTYDAAEQGRYDWHMDMTHGKNFQVPSRKLSVVMPLNDDFEGGEFQINTSGEDKAETLPMRKGRVIVFPSYIMHRVTPVTKGIRRSIVVWVVGPKFQ